jgi:hypothetical protein
MYQDICYRGVTYSVPERLYARSRRAPVILKYRGILYISGI